MHNIVYNSQFNNYMNSRIYKYGTIYHTHQMQPLAIDGKMEKFLSRKYVKQLLKNDIAHVSYAQV